MNDGYQQSLESAIDSERLSLSLMLAAFWRARCFLSLCIAGGILLACFYLWFVAEPLYTATAIIGPVASQAPASQGGASLASVVGIDIGGARSQELTKFMHVVQSARVAKRLEQRHHVTRVLFPGWSEQDNRFEPPEGPINALRRGFRLLLGLPAWAPPTSTSVSVYLRRYLQIDRDGITSIYTLSYSDRDRNFAVNFLNQVMTEADALVREDVLYNTRNRLQYIDSALRKMDQVDLRSSLLSIFTRQQQTLMTVQADRYYSIDMIDAPHADLLPTAPKPTLAILFMVVLAAGIGGFCVVLRLRRLAMAGVSTSELLDRVTPRMLWWRR